MTKYFGLSGVLIVGALILSGNSYGSEISYDDGSMSAIHRWSDS